jgi:hypothetical protein
MTLRKRFAWVLILIFVVISFLYIRSHRQAEPLEAFQQILNLTPDELQNRCGSPILDNNKVAVDNYGMAVSNDIRDLSYTDKSGYAVIFFRFISDDGKAWKSLGAWDDVSLYELGKPLDSAETYRRMPCAVKSGFLFATLFRGTPKVRRSSAPNELAVFLFTPQSVTDTTPHSYPGSGMGYGGVHGSNSNLGSGQTSNLGNINLKGSGPITSAPKPTGPGSGSGDGSDAPQGGNIIIVPCPLDADPCQYISYLEFIAEIKQAIQYEKENDFDRALHTLTGDRIKIIELPKLALDRRDAIVTIFKMEVKAINIMQTRLSDDITKLQQLPTFQNDSAAVKQQKLDVVMEDDRQNRRIWKSGVDESRSSTVGSSAYSDTSSTSNSSDSSSTSTIRFESHAYQQAVQIHISGKWPD